MKKFLSIVSVFAFAAFILLSVSGNARAEETKMVGVITTIEISGKEATTAAVTLKDNKTEQLITLTVNDELTIDKFKDHRIVEGDEIRCKFEVKDDKNVSTYFRKTAGC